MLPTRDDLLPWMLRYLQDREHADGIRVLDEYAWDFRVLGGILERVRRAARAYLLLEKRGYAAEGRFLVRSAIEHAVTAQWAYLTRDGLDRLEVKVLYARVDYAKQSRDDDDPEWGELIDGLREKIPRNNDGSFKPGMPKFTGREGVLATMDETGYLRRAYAVLSRAGHVTDQAVSDYFTIEEDGTVVVANAPSHEHDIDVFHTLATCCALAAWILARLEGDARGIELATSQRLLFRLDTHLSLQERRFLEETD